MLKAPDVPSVLLELGYLSNPDDEKLFSSDSWPGGEAETVARAIEGFRDRAPDGRAIEAVVAFGQHRRQLLEKPCKSTEFLGISPQFHHKNPESGQAD